MRRILKTANNCYKFNQKPIPRSASEATSGWKNFRGHSKDCVRGILMREQYGLCAYSEIKLLDYSHGYHIEHLVPKSIDPQRTFDHTNLVLSAIENQGQIAKQNVFGGHAKFGSYDCGLFISCIDEESSAFFLYTSEGDVVPAPGLSEVDCRRAEYTIELLNLRAPVLVNARKNIIEEVDEQVDQHLQNGGCLESLASSYLSPVNDKLESFYSAILGRLELLCSSSVNFGNFKT